ncbi:class I SAM-dependent methyltransferase [Paraglaciecola mesophila]|uniref:Ribosomal RNA small subunit methyltransferase C n=1 Tax=Paraglaciecola mesophila TaxID=197222 RepID=A0ABU9SX96_9ALTE|tara:strand:+ start:3148 stop:4179 length:1032 start_codon:yes stop_codon:yes gene_type:complete
MLSAASQVLLRSEELLEQGKWLLVNPTDGHVFSELSNPEVYGFHQFFDIYEQSIAAAKAQGRDTQHQFVAAYDTDASFDGAVLYLPKAKAHGQMLLANIVACLKPGATLLVVGENKGGIKSAAKLLTPYSDNVNKIDSARHCAMFAAVVDKPVAPFDITKWQDVSEQQVADISFKVCSLPGVFSHGELDKGTQLLLDNIDRVVSGRILDFACGAGIIGCFAGLKNPQAQVVMSDVSALAIYCSQKSAELNGVKAQVIPSNGLRALTGKFAQVFTNPPFHTGIKTDYSVTEGFMQQLKNHLQDRGSLILVANKFLRYADELDKQFKSVQTLTETTKFSVYCCRR